LPTQASADSGFVIPKPVPTFAVTPTPKPQFTPRAARPSGDQSRWVTTDDYPSGDIRRGHTGVTRYRVAIGTNGRVTNCEVVKSSGWPSLDQSACNNLTRRAKFEPGTDETGARGGSYTGSVVWTLPEG
jgi:protein TonB